MKSAVLAAVLMVALCAYPATSISLWFSSTFNDLKFTLYRYGHCYAGLQPLSGSSTNETDHLVRQIRLFLDQGNYDNEQLANVSALMDNICRPNIDTSYPISVHINVDQFGNGHPRGKANRCRAIDDALDSMFYVFRRAALNRSEPLDFSLIQFYPNASRPSEFYNLTDLINTSWIKSETILEHVCSITNATKDYIEARSSNATAQARMEGAGGRAAGLASSLEALLSRLLEPILGLQRRLYLESSNRLSQLAAGVSSSLASVGHGIGSGLGRAGQRLFGSRANSTSAAAPNSSAALVNSSSTPSPTVAGSQASPAPVFKSTTSASLAGAGQVGGRPAAQASALN